LNAQRVFIPIPEFRFQISSSQWARRFSQRVIFAGLGSKRFHIDPEEPFQILGTRSG